MSIDNIKATLVEASESKAKFVEQAEKILQISETLKKCIEAGGTIYACGNGGSACDAMHFVEECVARYSKERPGIRAQHLMDPGTITCWSNDYEFASIFERQAETHLETKDALIVFSTSGSSENILRGLKAANDKGAQTIAFLGEGGGRAKGLSNFRIVVTPFNTSRMK